MPIQEFGILFSEVTARSGAAASLCSETGLTGLVPTRAVLTFPGMSVLTSAVSDELSPKP